MTATATTPTTKTLTIPTITTVRRQWQGDDNEATKMTATAVAVMAAVMATRVS